MEASERTPEGAVHAPELASLLTETRGPFATLYLGTEGAVQNAAQRAQTAWRSARDELSAQGAPEEVLQGIDPLVADAHTKGDMLAVIASADGTRHVEHGRATGTRELARWAGVPSILPLLEWRQHAVPHVVVLTDRTGADLFGFHLSGPDIHREVSGAEDPLTKVAPGGWSQRRFQARAENTWKENAHSVVEELTRLVRQVDARLVVAGGDVRALQLLEESLPKEVAPLYRTVEGATRSPDGTEDSIPAEVADVVSVAVAERVSAVIDRFVEERGQADRAADGVTAVVDALSRAQVEVLLIRDDGEEGRTAFFGEAPTQIALGAGGLEALGVESPQEGRLVDALVRAALGTGAGVLVIPQGGGPTDDVGAILRWSDQASE